MEYQEIPCAITREIEGKRYMIRKFGYNNQVLEEHLIPIPIEKITRTFKEDGTEDTLKQKIIPIVIDEHILDE